MTTGARAKRAMRPKRTSKSMTMLMSMPTMSLITLIGFAMPPQI